MFTTWITSGQSAERLDAMFYAPIYRATANKVEFVSYGKTFDDIRDSKRPIVYGVLKPEPGESGAPMVRNLDFSPPGIAVDQVLRIPQAQNQAFKRSQLNAGDLLVTIGGYVGTAAIVPSALAGGNINQHIARVSVDVAKTDAYFIWAFVECQYGRRLMERWVSGTAQPGVNIGDLRRINVPYPDFAIQRAIGNKVRKAERLRELAATSFMSAKQLVENFIRGSILSINMQARAVVTWVQSKWLEHRIDPSYYEPTVMELTRAIAGYRTSLTLGRLSPDMCNGPHGGIVYVGADQGIRYLRAKNIEALTVNDVDPVFISSSTHEQNLRAEVIPGDLVITITGANIGAVGVVPESIPRANIIQSIGKLRIVTSDDPAYVAAFLNSPYGSALISRESVNTAREGINFDYLSRVPVPLPPNDVQKAVGNGVRQATACSAEARVQKDYARAAVESLIDGTLNEATLLAEGEAIEQWLAENPSPYATNQ